MEQETKFLTPPPMNNQPTKNQNCECIPSLYQKCKCCAHFTDPICRPVSEKEERFARFAGIFTPQKTTIEVTQKYYK